MGSLEQRAIVRSGQQKRGQCKVEVKAQGSQCKEVVNRVAANTRKWSTERRRMQGSGQWSGDLCKEVVNTGPIQGSDQCSGGQCREVVDRGPIQRSDQQRLYDARKWSTEKWVMQGSGQQKNG